MTHEQYSSAAREVPSILNVSRDRLNPQLNAQILQSRLAVIESYKLRRGEQFLHWPHHVMNRWGAHLNRYKFNYALKGFFLALMVQDLRTWRA